MILQEVANTPTGLSVVSNTSAKELFSALVNAMPSETQTVTQINTLMNKLIEGPSPTNAAENPFARTGHEDNMDAASERTHQQSVSGFSRKDFSVSQTHHRAATHQQMTLDRSQVSASFNHKQAQS